MCVPKRSESDETQTGDEPEDIEEDIEILDDTAADDDADGHLGEDEDDKDQR